MNPINLLTDEYDRKARLYPALLLVAPVVGAGVALSSSVLPVLESLLPVLVGCGGAFLLSQLARDAGKKKEKHLFEMWDGMPSVTIFRHRDSRLTAVTKARYHKILSGLVEGAKAPTVQQEQNDPGAADATYSAWSDYLRVNTRDAKAFPLLSCENASYGYRRNVFGLRRVGAAVSLLSCIVCGIRLYIVYKSTSGYDWATMIAGGFAAILLLIWLFCFTANWVRLAADSYAKRLAECAETLTNKRVPTRKQDGK
jgi:hypothetical protein